MLTVDCQRLTVVPTMVDKWSLRDYFILWQDKKVIVEYLSGKSGLLKQFVKNFLVKK
ncbi:MAG: hypothetical protein F6K26_25065 [Moorea sp. SIO2I5]|nr:hypothetical protein [Moorena sp. SIO2I5]